MYSKPLKITGTTNVIHRLKLVNFFYYCQVQDDIASSLADEMRLRI
jgi:hypothetical protein